MGDEAPKVEAPPAEAPPAEAPPAEAPPAEAPPAEAPPDETPPAEAPPDETPPDEPEDYELSFSEGFQAHEGTISSIKTVAKDLGLTKDKAEKLVAAYEAQTTAAVAEHEKKWLDIRTQWVDNIKKDPALGGENYDATMTKVQTLVKEFGDDALVEFLKQSGLEANDAFVRFAAKVADATGEHEALVSGGPRKDAKTLQQRMYPTMLGKGE